MITGLPGYSNVCNTNDKLQIRKKPQLPKAKVIKAKAKKPLPLKRAKQKSIKDHDMWDMLTELGPNRTWFSMLCYYNRKYRGQ